MKKESPMKPGNPRILTINSGSSSIKFALYQIGEPLERDIDELLTRPAGLVLRRPLEAPRHRKVGGSVVCGGGKMYIAGRPGNQNGNSG